MLCTRCRYWDSLAARGAGDEDLGPAPAAGALETDLGRCRRHTPSVGGPAGRGQWPLTQATDWCGEFQDRGRDEL